MDFKYSKLKGAIAENNLNRTQLARLVGMFLSSLSLKLNKGRAFTQDDIIKIVKVLNIDASDIPIYIFDLTTCKIQVNQNRIGN